MKKEGRKRPKTCFGKSKENTSAAYSYERKRFQKCTPHIAVIDRKGHQAVTLGSVNVGHDPQCACLFSRHTRRACGCPHPLPGGENREDGSEGCVIHAGMRRRSWALTFFFCGTVHSIPDMGTVYPECAVSTLALHFHGVVVCHRDHKRTYTCRIHARILCHGPAREQRLGPQAPLEVRTEGVVAPLGRPTSEREHTKHGTCSLGIPSHHHSNMKPLASALQVAATAALHLMDC